MKALSLFALPLLFISCSQTKTKTLSFPKTIEEAVNSEFRNPENMKRDIYRHPTETLKFFGVTPEMTVIEITPGGGWYTEILAPMLVTSGKYIMAAPSLTPQSPAYAIENDKKLKNILNLHPDLKAKTQIVEFSQLGSLPGTADMVLTFRNVHNWLGNNTAQINFDNFFKALKPGGVLGIVEHRAAKGSKPDLKSGYMTEKQVIDLAKKAGFVLAAQSEINANPKDKANHPEGVWTLPPSLRLGDKDKDKYLAIGESDRTTLKFVKPKI